MPDVRAIAREFDYLVPSELATEMSVGAVVRVPLHGRTVRGWVVGVDVSPDSRESLLPVRKVSSVGPDAAMIDLCRWSAARWIGPLAAFLRTATPPNAVARRPTRLRDRRMAPAVERPGMHDVDSIAASLAARAREPGVSVVSWPPMVDRRALVADAVMGTGSALVITADGARAASLVRWLEEHGRDSVLYRSDMTAAARTAAWQRAAAGSCVVVGGRAAVFAPVPDLSVGVVVDDGDEALQEERTPTWHARDVLVERCRRVGARLIVIGAAPTLEAFRAADRELEPPRAFSRSGWPRVTVVDRRNDPPGAGLLGSEIASVVRREVDRNGLALCVLNRRGRVRVLACGDCGHLLRWDAKGQRLWESADSVANAAGTARVSEETQRPAVCPRCGGRSLRVVRSGIGKLREELEALIPHTTVGDVDAATDVAPDAAILVGTESLLHRVEVRRRRPGAVVFLDFDQELLAPRFRAAEQALHLVVRAARVLAGRPSSESMLVLQTRLADHDVVRAAFASDPALLREAELSRRQELMLPPFVALAEAHGEPAAVERLASELRLAHDPGSVTVLGPSPVPGGATMLVKARDHTTLSAAIELALAGARRMGRVNVAVDPPRV